MAGGGELGHVYPDLGHDDLGGPPVHTGDGVKPLYLHRERGDHLFDPGAQRGDRLVQVVDVSQDVADQQAVVLGPEPPLERLL